MRRLTLREAVLEIGQAVSGRKPAGDPCPFFFMVGAGISTPSIPLAAAIQKRCKAEARKYGKSSLPFSRRPIDTYSHFMEQAYPSPADRRRYLKSLAERATISNANFRLAHLLRTGKLGSLAVTTNFDDLLARALTRQYDPPVVIDDEYLLPRFEPNSKEIQILQIHGSYRSTACCNLTNEIRGRSRGSRATSFTMASALDDILKRRSPIVVGYAGWREDAFMTALKRRLSIEVGTNLYWFCYRRSDADPLPAWLINHRGVRVIVPEDPREGNQARTGTSVSGHRSGTTKLPHFGTLNRHPGTVIHTDAEVLPATDVFDALIDWIETRRSIPLQTHLDNSSPTACQALQAGHRPTDRERVNQFRRASKQP